MMLQDTNIHHIHTMSGFVRTVGTPVLSVEMTTGGLIVVIQPDEVTRKYAKTVGNPISLNQPQDNMIAYTNGNHRS